MANKFSLSGAMKFIQHILTVNTTNNTAVLLESRPWSRAEKSLLVAVLSVEMVLGVLGNSMVLIVKIVVRARIDMSCNFLSFCCLNRSVTTLSYLMCFFSFSVNIISSVSTGFHWSVSLSLT